MSVPSNVIDKDLYITIRNKIKKRVKVWPSAYASGQLVSEYKKSGGRYEKDTKKISPLERWYQEKWVNVCESYDDGYEPCGRTKSEMKNYPYCRPSKRVNKDTPMTVGEIEEKYGKKKLQELCKKKRLEALPKKGRAKRISPKETRKS